jgi:hypothetical protein
MDAVNTVEGGRFRTVGIRSAVSRCSDLSSQ